MDMTKLILVLVVATAAFVLLLQMSLDVNQTTGNTTIPSWFLQYRILFLFLFVVIIVFALAGLIRG